MRSDGRLVGHVPYDATITAFYSLEDGAMRRSSVCSTGSRPVPQIVPR